MNYYFNMITGRNPKYGAESVYAKAQKIRCEKDVKTTKKEK